MEPHCQCGFCHPTLLQHSGARRRVINSVCLPPFGYFVGRLLRLSPSLHLTLSAPSVTLTSLNFVCRFLRLSLSLHLTLSLAPSVFLTSPNLLRRLSPSLHLTLLLRLSLSLHLTLLFAPSVSLTSLNFVCHLLLSPSLHLTLSLAPSISLTSLNFVTCSFCLPHFT